MARQLRIPQEGISNIEAVIRSIGALAFLKAIVNDLGPDKATVSAIEKGLAAKAKLPLRESQKIVRQIISLLGLRARMGIAPAEFYDALSESLEVDASDEWKERNLDGWKKAKDAFIDVTGPEHPLHVIEKALRLANEHQNILFFSNIITDLRPIFDDTGSNIVQLEVQHSLGIEYYDGDTRTKVFFALDATDIADLKRVCERAQAKEITLKSKMKNFDGAITSPGEMDE